MTGSHFSLILLPTMGCNADCEYCFENKTNRHLSLDHLQILIEKVMDFLEQKHIGRFSIYWQGGEVMTLSPEWFERANIIIRQSAEAREVEVTNYIQSNLIGYSKKWNKILLEMFDNSVGSSMDFPNLHRRLTGGRPEEYEAIWTRNIREAREAGIRVSVIALPNDKTLQMGARRFYSYFVDELKMSEFQVNTPFPGGSTNRVKDGYPLDSGRLGQFLLDLAEIWVEEGFNKGIKISPFDRLLEYFAHDRKNLLCIWQDNCVNDFICIDPQGYVSQCDCWAASYPDFRFGNIFGNDSLFAILGDSDVRQQLQKRPGILIRREDCIDCEYLGICHGGCPVRSYTVQGDIHQKDPYCPVYRIVFKGMERLAATRPLSCR